MDILGINLSIVKTLITITHATTDKVQFLGFDISIIPYTKTKHNILTIESLPNNSGINRSRVQILAPTTQLVEQLSIKGYCCNGQKGVPTRMGKLINLTLPMIIEHYLMVGRVILNYYAYADNFTTLKYRISYILKYSCGLTFAAKLRIPTIKRVFIKYGYDLKVNE